MKNSIPNIFVSQTSISDVNFVEGTFTLRGVPIKELCIDTRLESVIELLWKDLFPNFPTGSDLQSALGQAREQIFLYTEDIDDELFDMKPVDAVRTLMTKIPDVTDLTTALHLIAAPAVFAPAFIRMKRGRHSVRPDASIPHSVDILRMMNLSLPSDQEVSALDTYLISCVDYGLTPPTLAARLAASVNAGMTSSILAALSVFSGSSHDSKSDGILDILDAFQSNQTSRSNVDFAVSERRNDWVKNNDPRTEIIKDALLNVENSGSSRFQSRLSLVEQLFANQNHKALSDTVGAGETTELKVYSALLLEQLGFAREVFSCVLSMGRSIGWIAHSREQVNKPWLIRPQLEYIRP
ncbi:citrate/2-methylcitrate synthase [Brucella sp. C7-11G]